MSQHNYSKPRLLAAQTVQEAPWPTLPIIGIAGHARAGKNTIAELLKQEYSCLTYAFANPLKAMLRTLGLSDRELEGWRKDELNNEYQATPRHMMQTLGTEWGRDSINEDIWVIAAAHHLQLQNQRMPTVNIIITDVRFENEADFVRQHGFLIHTERPIQRIDGSTHRSENPLRINESEDFVIINDGDIDDLREEVLRVAMHISNKANTRLEVAHAS